MMKRLLLYFAIMTLPLVASAERVEIDGIYYNLNNEGKTAEVAQTPQNYSGSIIIPETVTYKDVVYSVTTIERDAFTWCSNLTKVIVPDIGAWCGINFTNGSQSNPLNISRRLYSDEDTEIRVLVIPEGVEVIKNTRSLIAHA